MLTLALQPLREALVANTTALAEALTRTLGGRDRRGDATATLVQGHARLQGLLRWLPQDDAQRQPLERLLRLLPALLQPQPVLAQARLLAFVFRLQQEHGGGVPWRQSPHRPGPAAQPLLASGWRAGQATLADSPHALVAPLWHEAMAVLVAAVRQRKDMRLCCAALQRLQGGLLAATPAAQAPVVARTVQRLALWCVCPAFVTTDELPTLWTRLWQFTQGEVPSPDAAPAGLDLALLQAVRSDLDRYRWQLQTFLQQCLASAETALPYDILLAHYRLPWIVAAAGQPALADLAQLWHHLLLQHWQFRVPLSAAVLQRLQQFAALMDQACWSMLDDMETSRWHWQLLALVPAPQRSSQPASLLLDGNAVPLASIPALLSRSFLTLTAATEVWFTDRDAFAPQATAYLADLRLLEQGAAAVRMHAVESVCSHWLALLQRLLHDATLEWPAALLQRSHHHLLALLDEAAAWQLPQLDLGLVAELRDAGTTSEPDAPAVHEPYALEDCSAQLRQRLQRQVDQLAAALDRPLRLQVVVTQLLGAAESELCLAVLLPLLREEVLVQVQAQQPHRPRVVGLQVEVVPVTAGVRVVLAVEGGECSVEATLLQRLRHRLPAGVQQLDVTALPGRGRRFELVIGR